MGIFLFKHREQLCLYVETIFVSWCVPHGRLVLPGDSAPEKTGGFLILFCPKQPFPSLLLFLRSYKRLAVVKGRPGCYSNSVAGGDRSSFISCNRLWRVFNTSQWLGAHQGSFSGLHSAWGSILRCMLQIWPPSYLGGRGWEHGGSPFPQGLGLKSGSAHIPLAATQLHAQGRLGNVI